MKTLILFLTLFTSFESFADKVVCGRTEKEINEKLVRMYKDVSKITLSAPSVGVAMASPALAAFSNSNTTTQLSRSSLHTTVVICVSVHPNKVE
jgi:hypothetical protein